MTSRKNVVLPYITIRSPGSATPTLSASDWTSSVPIATGIPAGSPVSAAAPRVTSPTWSAGHPTVAAGRGP